jgi:putative membrane protein
MIHYDSRRWSQVVLRFYRSTVLRRLALAIALISAYSGGIVAAIRGGHLPAVDFPPTFFPLCGILLSLLLAFRTNTAYDRWWEGRKLWGGLVNSSRNLAAQLDAVLPPDATEERWAFAADLAAFASAMKSSLRDEPFAPEPGDYDAATIETLGRRMHVPGAISARLMARVYALAKAGRIRGDELITLGPSMTSLLDLVGGCERIRATPIPFSYDSYIKHLVVWFSAILPFGLHKDFGLLTIPASAIAFAALAGLEMLAVDIEDPFGSDSNDLPTGKLASMIRRDVRELLLGPDPRALGPSSTELAATLSETH